MPVLDKFNWPKIEFLHAFENQASLVKMAQPFILGFFLEIGRPSLEIRLLTFLRFVSKLINLRGSSSGQSILCW